AVRPRRAAVAGVTDPAQGSHQGGGRRAAVDGACNNQILRIARVGADPGLDHLDSLRPHAPDRAHPDGDLGRGRAPRSDPQSQTQYAGAQRPPGCKERSSIGLRSHHPIPLSGEQGSRPPQGPPAKITVTQKRTLNDTQGASTRIASANRVGPEPPYSRSIPSWRVNPKLGASRQG